MIRFDASFVVCIVFICILLYFFDITENEIFANQKKNLKKGDCSSAAVAQVIQHTYFASSIPQNFESFPQVKIKHYWTATCKYYVVFQKLKVFLILNRHFSKILKELLSFFVEDKS